MLVLDPPAGALLCPPAALVDPAAAARPVAAPLKKPRTAFNFYSDAVRPAAKEKHPRADQKVRGTLALCANASAATFDSCGFTPPVPQPRAAPLLLHWYRASAK